MDACQIELSDGRHAIVDACDVYLASQYRWYPRTGSTGIVYAVRLRQTGTGPLGMHVLLMSPAKGMFVDHRDRDGLNNRRSNLRICTHAQNMANRVSKPTITSPYKGVNWYEKTKTWCAHVTCDHERRHLGYFRTPEDAAMAYDLFARQLFGEFALPNFPEVFTTEAEIASLRLNRPTPKRFGEKNTGAKLTADDVREIRRLRADGVSAAELASRYGVHWNTIYRIVNRKKWPHI